jgi:hypothetical protein
MTFIRALYQNQAVLNLRKIHPFFSVGLFVLIVFLLTLPYQIGSFSVSGERLLNELPGFKQDLLTILETYDCVIDQSLSCSQQNIRKQLKTYQLALQYPAYEDLDTTNLIVMNANYMTVTNARAEVVVVGNYANFGQVSFESLSQDIKAGLIDGEVFAQDFLRLIDLSQFFERFYVQMTIVGLQNLIYILVIAFFLGFIQRRKDVHIRFLERFNMVIILMFSPALLSVMVSFYVPEGALIIFSVLLMVRLYLLYQGLLKRSYIL